MTSNKVQLTMRKFITGTILIMILFIVSCKNETKKKRSEPVVTGNAYLLKEKGREVVGETFLALSSELQNAMKSGGPSHALSYCNLNALSITDSLASAYNVNIKRTSLKYRNEKNRPTAKEEEILKSFERKKDEEAGLSPILNSDDELMVFYAPIIVQDMCLKCHGVKTGIENYDQIKQLYPNDLAHGYKQGDVRGMWSITFLEEI